jgi:hypothetical protein
MSTLVGPPRAYTPVYCDCKARQQNINRVSGQPAASLQRCSAVGVLQRQCRAVHPTHLHPSSKTSMHVTISHCACSTAVLNQVPNALTSVMVPHLVVMEAACLCLGAVVLRAARLDDSGHHLVNSAALQTKSAAENRQHPTWAQVSKRSRLQRWRLFLQAKLLPLAQP